MKLKPFNLEEWLKDKNQPVYTRDGRKIIEMYFFEKSKGNYPISGIVEGHEINGICLCWRKNGSFLNEYADNENEFDLMLVEKDAINLNKHELESNFDAIMGISSICLIKLDNLSSVEKMTLRKFSHECMRQAYNLGSTSADKNILNEIKEFINRQMIRNLNNDIYLSINAQKEWDIREKAFLDILKFIKSKEEDCSRR